MSRRCGTSTARSAGRRFWTTASSSPSNCAAPVDAEFFTGRSAYLCDPEGNYFEIAWADAPTNPVVIATRRAAGG
jgi:hypothetical protein